MHASLLLLSILPTLAVADVVTGIPDPAPAGYEQWVSPVVVPAKNVTGDGGWAAAVAKARTMVAGLTLDEKINITTGVGTGGRCVGNTGDITRLGIAGFCMEDSPLGVRDTDFASAFPAAINAAATWDTSLILARGQAMGAEHRGKGVNVALGPMTNLGRVAAAGRNWEGWGADPFLAGVGSAQTVIGYQQQGVIACVKHLVGNEQEHYRGGSEASQIYSSNIDDKTMHELYIWPFAEAINAGVGSVMCSYNSINQTQACQNSKVLNGIVKEELDFQGFIMSDWAAMISGIQPALAGVDMNMPGFLAYGGPGYPGEPNPDNTTGSWWGSALIADVNNGSVPLSRVDDMVTRVFAAYYKMGQDQNYPPINFDYNTEDTYLNGVLVNEHVNVQADHYKLIREIGAASAILLKNTNSALPLNAKQLKRLGIFGSDAGVNPDGPNGCGDRGCDIGTLAMGWGSGTANFPYLVDPLSAITEYVHGKNPDVVIDGITDDYNYGAISSAASLADACLVFVNADSGEGYINVDGNAGDRTNLTLFHAGEQLINAAASVCSNTIVVGHVVGPVLVESWINNPNVTAYINAGIPGQESGNAIVDVLFGAVNPSGRLPYTIAKQRSDYPADIVYSSNAPVPQITYSEGVLLDYRWFDAHNIAPRYEFGFGLSYTKFTYSGLSITQGAKKRDVDAAAKPKSSASASSISASGSTSASGVTSAPVSSASASANSTSTISHTSSTNATTTVSAAPVVSSPAQTNPGGPSALFNTVLTVSFEVQNSGSSDGSEVSQVYLGFPASANEPPKVLRGFQRTQITKGQTAYVNIPLRKKDISIWDVVLQQWIVPKGTFTVYVGASSRDIRLTGTFTQ